VIDADTEAGFDQVFVGDFGPAAAPIKQCLSSVPAAVLRAEAFGGEIARGEEYVGVGVIGIVAVDADVGDHASRDEFTHYEVAEQCDLLFVLELDGQPYFDLARDLGVLARLGGFDGIP
jgi:hypothetical protein